MRLTINLSTRTYINARQLNLVLLVLILLLTGFLFVNVLGISSKAGEIARIRGEMDSLDRKSGTDRRPVPEQDYKRVMTQIRFANEIINKKAFSWLSLIDRLEAVTPDGIAFTIIEPDPKKQSLKLAGSTLSFSRLRQLLENMEQTPGFSDIYLVSQNQTSVGEKQKGISFTITCQVTP
jgi:type IV pilus assembly protein PilN